VLLDGTNPYKISVISVKRLPQYLEVVSRGSALQVAEYNHAGAECSLPEDCPFQMLSMFRGIVRLF
jgi:hypothetical protein